MVARFSFFSLTPAPRSEFPLVATTLPPPPKKPSAPAPVAPGNSGPARAGRRVVSFVDENGDRRLRVVEASPDEYRAAEPLTLNQILDPGFGFTGTDGVKYRLRPVNLEGMKGLVALFESGRVPADFDAAPFNVKIDVVSALSAVLVNQDRGDDEQLSEVAVRRLIPSDAFGPISEIIWELVRPLVEAAPGTVPAAPSTTPESSTGAPTSSAGSRAKRPASR